VKAGAVSSAELDAGLSEVTRLLDEAREAGWDSDLTGGVDSARRRAAAGSSWSAIEGTGDFMDAADDQLRWVVIGRVRQDDTSLPITSGLRRR
jgi:hypothetical protein